MHNRQNGHYPRGQLQKRYSSETSQLFSPTISAERPIIWQDEEGEQRYSRAIPRRHHSKSRSSQRRRRHAVTPEALSVVQVWSAVLADKSLEIHRFDQRQAAIERLAAMLQERLYESLKGIPERLPVRLGRLACFTEPSALIRGQPHVDKQLVGMRLMGWKGPKAHYPAEDIGGGVSALRQLAVESKLYVDAIDEVNPWLEPEEIVTNPNAIVLKQRQEPVNGSELTTIDTGLLEESMSLKRPFLGDPVLRLILGTAPDQIIQLPIRDLDNRAA